MPKFPDYQRSLTTLLIACSLITTIPAEATERPATTARAEQLQQLRTRIRALQQEMLQTREERDAVQNELEGLERRIGLLIFSIRTLSARLQNDRRRLQGLLGQKQGLQLSLRQNNRQHGNQIRNAYLLGHQGYLKLILSRQDPAGRLRRLTYYQYLSRAQNQEISRIRDKLALIRSLETKITLNRYQIERLRTQQLQQKRALESARSRRGAVLANLNRKIRSQQQAIQRLQRDQRRLQNLVTRIQEVTAVAPLPTELGLRFATQKGKLSLPISGNLLGRYGSPTRVGNLRWRGVFLAAPAGQAVKAIFRGRVVYADWLPGFGLLLILEHGDGYMSLYAHNQSLFKTVGDWVDAGEVIATSGNTGSPPRAGLYFEIRYNGKPRNPLLWGKLQ